VRFWDASAIVPLCVEEPRSQTIDRALEDDPQMVVWWTTPVECASAFVRLECESILDPRGLATAHELLRQFERRWHEVQPSIGIRDLATQLLRLHDLRAADALQLAAACEWSGRPASGDFLTFDARLLAAAQREGFSAPELPPG